MTECGYCGAREEKITPCCSKVKRLWEENSVYADIHKEHLATIRELKEKIERLEKQVNKA